jgi:hypothetical protein
MDRSTLKRIVRPEPRDIDELYGLEPVYEPGQGGAPGSLPEEFVSILCPYCNERLEVRVDVSAGSQSYIEDCQVCCSPMELGIEVNDDGALHGVRVQRMG